jgi:hypothetical protein
VRYHLRRCREWVEKTIASAEAIYTQEVEERKRKREAAWGGIGGVFEHAYVIYIVGFLIFIGVSIGLIQLLQGLVGYLGIAILIISLVFIVVYSLVGPKRKEQPALQSLLAAVDKLQHTPRYQMA